IIELANEYNRKIKIIGSGHSPSDIGCTDGFMISMYKMDHILSVVASDDSEEGVKLVTVEAGIELSKLNKELSENQLN
ncbi:20550_t:CDS:1, partial [Entrophospora sp. SA101]